MAVSANRISGFTRKPPRNARSCAKPLAVDLSDTAQRRVGEIFGVLKAEASDKNCEALVAHIEDALVRGVFEALRKLPRDASQEAVLESAIAKVNDALFRLLGEDGLSLGPETISGAVISQHGKELSAAIWGRPSVLLFHPTNDGRIQIYDLADDGGHASDNAGRGFAQIISGTMTARDRLLVTSEDLRNPLGDETLSEAVLGGSPEESVVALDQLLTEAKQNFPLTVFLTDSLGRAETTEAPAGSPLSAKTPHKTAKTDQSIRRLIDTQSQTKEIMSPPLWSSLRRKLRSLFGWLGGTVPGLWRGWRERKEEQAVLESQKSGARSRWSDPEPSVEPPAPIDEPSMPTAEQSADELDAMEATLEEAAAEYAEYDKVWDETADSAMRSGLTEEPTEPRIRRSAGEVIHESLTVTVEAINDLPRVGKAVIVLILAGLSALNVSGIYLGWQETQRQIAAEYQQSIDTIEQKIDSAEASLIYHDDARARSLLKEAESLIAELPEESDKQAENKRALTSKLSERRLTANRAVELAAPEVVASLNGEAGPLPLRRLAELNDRVYAATAEGQIYAIDEDGGASKKAATDGSTALFLSDDKRLLATNAAGQFLSLAANGQSSDGQLAWSGESIEPTDAVTWGSRLYVLDAAHNRLIRHYATASGWGSPNFYLKDGTDVSKGVSMAVDGNLWVLNSDGAVTKIRLGKREPFSLAEVEPALVNAKRLRTDEASDNLWILDPANRRLLAFSKETGELVNQFLSDRLAGADDFLVDEPSGEVLAAQGNAVLRFELPE